MIKKAILSETFLDDGTHSHTGTRTQHTLRTHASKTQTQHLPRVPQKELSKRLCNSPLTIGSTRNEVLGPKMKSKGRCGCKPKRGGLASHTMLHRQV